jgi:hypothetical protein
MSKLIPGSSDWCEVAEELAAKVRGYFTDFYGKVEIPKNMDGDRDLYEIASRLTTKQRQPGSKK